MLPLRPSIQIVIRGILSFLLVKSQVISRAFVDMMADSPVKFPEQGALPSGEAPGLAELTEAGGIN